MFGIGSGEMLVFAVVVLIALGPKRLPDFMRTVGKGLREVRKATNDLRKHSGIDELMRDDPAGLRALSRDISRAPAPRREQKLSADDLAKEAPPEGVDIAHARYLAEKNAVAAKEAALETAAAQKPAVVSVGATVAIESPEPAAAASAGFEGDTVPDKATASPPVRHEPTMMGIPAVDPYALPAAKSVETAESVKSAKKTLDGLSAGPTSTTSSEATPSPKASAPPPPPRPSAPPPRPSAPPPSSRPQASVPPPPPRTSARPSAPPPPVPVTRSAPPPPPSIGPSNILGGKRPSLPPSIPPPAPSLPPSAPPAPESASKTRESTMAIDVEDLTLDDES